MVAAPPSYGLVMEYCSGGDLSSALSKVTLPLPLTPNPTPTSNPDPDPNPNPNPNPNLNPNPNHNPNLNPNPNRDQGKVTPAGFVLMAASGVAAGMAHLHLRGVLHRDLKVCCSFSCTPEPNPTPNPTLPYA